jgi:RNA-binding protein YhbY
MTTQDLEILDIKYIYKKSLFTFKCITCSHCHTRIYYLKEGPEEYIENIDLIINNELIKVKVNKYPEFKNEIIMSTIVKNEDTCIIQWIEFHSRIGVTRFIIYDNSDEYNLGNLLSYYILSKKVVLIKWNYPYLTPRSGISGQTTQQNHSLYAFQKCKFIGLFDVDEYVNIQKKINIHTSI